MPKQQLDGLYVFALLDQPRCHSAPTTVRRTTTYAGVAVKLRDVGLNAVASQVLDWLTGPTHAPLGVQMELVALVRQDQLWPAFKAASISGNRPAICAAFDFGLGTGAIAVRESLIILKNHIL